MPVLSVYSLIPGPSSNGQKQGVVVGDYWVTIYDHDIESGSVDWVLDRYSRIDKGFDVSVSEEGPNEFAFELKRK
ncbi:hypothetical protein [Bremerella volcania]|uniref:hypothetical protein n=1 Tax=Bremerella volcania TaxID=2527984 RepID=UPI0011AAEDBF|nr:hypothetical protein [Bremerella volcania]